jgi:cell division protein FtsL
MFLETTPDTSSYMIAGFVVTFVSMGIYIISLYIRNRNLKQDIEALESMQTEKPKAMKK